MAVTLDQWKALNVSGRAGLAGKEYQLVVFPRQKNFFEALAEGMEDVRMSTKNPDTLDMLHRLKKEAETPKVMVVMPEVEVR